MWVNLAKVVAYLVSSLCLSLFISGSSLVRA